MKEHIYAFYISCLVGFGLVPPQVLWGRVVGSGATCLFSSCPCLFSHLGGVMECIIDRRQGVFLFVCLFVFFLGDGWREGEGKVD
ncbi:hypothetical protein PSV09DRAFT_2353079 [Bipolaris maydis]|nr:hypothetical protein J3E73DRAFT_300080 [Bipolaris maydis]KAJ5063070.1 hypothetical protein J3E74DRAFT_327029 [Bipolaris maydis]KAJ6204043.1 hypothetical protein PSV09DRAFT_2353079 [Bipolaris maydis]KAJ6283599.1 hypothetical protein J3E71DRAFT_283434 [Bipolaris maydis]